MVDDLDNYGLLPNIAGEQRNKVLDRFARMYSPAIGTGAVMDYMGQTGLDTLEGADILKEAPKMYSSGVEYPDTSIAKKLKGIAQVHMANFGTRVFYVDHGSFDSHSNQVGMHDKLWYDVSHAMDAFLDDLKEHNVDDSVVVLMFTEFGRRTHDNGSGTDHGAGGAAFMFGSGVKGRTVQRIPLPGGEGPGAGRCGPQLRLPRPVHHRPWKTGWAWMPSLWWAEPTKSCPYWPKRAHFPAGFKSRGGFDTRPYSADLYRTNSCFASPQRGEAKQLGNT